MLIRIFVPWVVLAGLLGFVLGGSYVWAFLDFRHTPAHQQDAEPKEKTSEAKAAEEKEKTDRLLAEYTFWLMLFTGVLAVATVGLGIATYGLYATGEKQIRLIREGFNATHRPRIGIRSVHTLTRDKEGFLAFVYVNRGIGIAKITQIGCAVILGEFIRTAPAFEIKDIPGMELASGDSTIYEYIPHNAAEFSFGRGFETNADPTAIPFTAFFVGLVTYEDSEGRRRETGFCRKNAPGTDLWEVVENSPYEYED